MAKSKVAARLKVADARRLLLAGAGLLTDPATSPSAISIVRSLGFLQVDSINVIERAHELILHARSDAYRRESVFRELERGKLFEHWTHDASLIPVESYPHWHHRFERFKTRGWHLSRLGPGAEELVPRVLSRIREEGPLMSRDFEGDSEKRAGGWWNWKPAKAVLELLWRTGQLAVAGRRNFQKVYDLPERVVPNWDEPATEWGAFVEWACATALERLGVATPTELREFYAVIDLPAARGWVHENLKSGRVVPVEVEGRVQVAFADVGRKLGKCGESPDRVRLLAPFDPVLRDRKRAERLFGFRYRFEAFTPAARRVHGYYVLPMLYREQLVGRADAKFDRGAGVVRLTVQAYEAGFKATREFKRELEAAAEKLKGFVGAEKIEVRRI